MMGKNITYENEINKMCRALFGKLWGGVFARDKMEKALSIPPNERLYYIFNLDTRAQGGSHWCACAVISGQVHIYDSFARTIDVGVNNAQHSDLNDREQYVKEKNCGQRCIAWLLVCEQYGIKTAMKI